MRIRIIDDGQSRKPNFTRRLWNAIMLGSVLFAPGLLAGSAAMQWAGFVVLLFLVFMSIYVATIHSFTIEEARKFLDHLEKKEKL